jgi:hypothetical protein
MSTSEDIEYLSGIIAEAASGLTEIGFMEGFKVAKAFVSITGAGQGRELGARFLAKLWNKSPPSMEAAPPTAVEADLEYLASLMSNLIGGAVAMTAAEGLKMNAALGAVRRAKANSILVQRIWTRFCQVNPQAQFIIKSASAWSPALAAWAQKAGV